MADRTSADIFGRIFTLLASEGPNHDKEDLAKEIWDIAQDYDFDPSQMSCDPDTGIMLGLCKKGINPEYPQDGEVYLWLDKYAK